MPALMKIVHGPYAFHTKFQFKRKKKKDTSRNIPRISLPTFLPLHFHQGSHFVPPVRNPLIKITDADIKHRRVRCTRVGWKERGKKRKGKAKSSSPTRKGFAKRDTHARAEKPCKRGEHGTLSPGIPTPRVLSSPTRRIPMRRPRPRHAAEYSRDPRLRYDRAARV